MRMFQCVQSGLIINLSAIGAGEFCVWVNLMHEIWILFSSEIRVCDVDIVSELLNVLSEFRVKIHYFWVVYILYLLLNWIQTWINKFEKESSLKRYTNK